MDKLKLRNVAEQQAERKPVLMKCGCVAHATCSHRNGVTYDPPIPSCFVHDCDEIAKSEPDLAGRMARCAYFGHVRFRNYGPIYGGGKCSGEKCECLVPSSLELPFFRFRGAGSPTAREFCSCGKALKLHWPRWRATIKVVRRWYKIERHEAIESAEECLPDAEWAGKWAERERQRWLKMGHGPSFSGDTSEPTKVYSAELLAVQEVPNTFKACKDFKAAGPAANDEFFCGCAGWD